MNRRSIAKFLTIALSTLFLFSFISTIYFKGVLDSTTLVNDINRITGFAETFLVYNNNQPTDLAANIYSSLSANLEVVCNISDYTECSKLLPTNSLNVNDSIRSISNNLDSNKYLLAGIEQQFNLFWSTLILSVLSLSLALLSLLFWKKSVTKTNIQNS